jgi:hypothetical protein
MIWIRTFMMPFLQCLVGGILAVIVTWFIIVAVSLWRINEAARARGINGLGAIAGGSTQLLHTPLVLILLTLAFGMGLYIVSYR